MGLSKYATMKKLGKRFLYFSKVKNYNFNVTEVRDSTLKKRFPGIFNFTIGILSSTQKFGFVKNVLSCSMNHALSCDLSL